MKPFREWTYSDARDAVKAAIASTVGEAGYAANRDILLRQDYWRNGRGYVGPRGDRSVEARILKQVEPQFTPVDTAGEVVDNVVGALAGTEPTLGFPARTPARQAADEQDRAAKRPTRPELMQAALAADWDEKGVAGRYHTAIAYAAAFARGALRVWIAATSLERPPRPEDAPADAPDPAPELPTGLSFAEALRRVEISAPQPDAAHVYVDPDTQQRAAIFLFELEEAGRTARSRPKRVPAAELWYVEGEGDAAVTVCRVIKSSDKAAPAIGEDGRPADAYVLPLGGVLPIAEMTADLLLTEPVRRQMNQANFEESVVGRIVETAGFAERTVINAQPNGIWLKDPPKEGPALKVHQDGADTWYLHPAPRVLGSNVITELVGIDITDGETGRTTMTTPGVVYKEPTDPEFAIKAALHRRYTILRDCKQGHLAGGSTAESSGLAYIQARAGFAKDLQRRAGGFEGMLRDALTAKIRLADAMTDAGDPLKGFLDDYRVQVTAHPDPGPRTPEEEAQILARWQAGLISRERTHADLGIEDTDEERQALERDPMAQLALLKAQGEVLEVLARASSLEAALRLLVLKQLMTPEEAAAFEPRDVDGTGVVVGAIGEETDTDEAAA